jgi:hypothetical protein
MHSDRPALSVVAGLTYREPSQVFNRWLLPVYQHSIRWTGNRLDAEDATAWVMTNEVSRLDLPELVPVVDERLAAMTRDAIGRHWSERYGVSQLRCASIHAIEAAPPHAFDSLLDGLSADERLGIVLRFLRMRTLSAIATQLGISAGAGANLLYRGLSKVAARLGIDADPGDLGQVTEVVLFVSDVVARRRPLRFEASPSAWAAVLAATHIQAAIAGNDLPRLRFVRTLELLVTLSRI